MFSDLSYTVFSKWYFSFYARVRIKTIENATVLNSVGICPKKQYLRVYFRSLWFGRKATLDCLKWSVLDYSCRPNIEVGLCFKSNTRYLILDSVFQYIRFRSVFNRFRSSQDIAFAISMDRRQNRMSNLRDLIQFVYSFTLYLFCGYDWISFHSMARSWGNSRRVRIHLSDEKRLA